MCGVGKVNVVARHSFPPFPSHYVPCRPHLTAMFVKDYWENKGMYHAGAVNGGEQPQSGSGPPA